MNKFVLPRYCDECSKNKTLYTVHLDPEDKESTLDLCATCKKDFLEKQQARLKKNEDNVLILKNAVNGFFSLLK